MYKQYKEHNMEKRIAVKIDAYCTEFKDDIINVVSRQCDEQTLNILTNYINNYNNFNLTKEDFSKRKRVKNIVPFYDRCCARRANNDRCTRRRKDDCKFCGTHVKGQPHGIIDNNDDENTMAKFKKITVRQQDIKGIIYYIDDEQNVYNPSDIVNGNAPRIIAKYVSHADGSYTIPEFNI